MAVNHRLKCQQLNRDKLTVSFAERSPPGVILCSEGISWRCMLVWESCAGRKCEVSHWQGFHIPCGALVCASNGKLLILLRKPSEIAPSEIKDLLHHLVIWAQPVVIVCIYLGPGQLLCASFKCVFEMLTHKKYTPNFSSPSPVFLFCATSFVSVFSWF